MLSHCTLWVKTNHSTTSNYNRNSRKPLLAAHIRVNSGLCTWLHKACELINCIKLSLKCVEKEGSYCHFLKRKDHGLACLTSSLARGFLSPTPQSKWIPQPPVTEGAAHTGYNEKRQQVIQQWFFRLDITRPILWVTVAEKTLKRYELTPWTKTKALPVRSFYKTSTLVFYTFLPSLSRKCMHY